MSKKRGKQHLKRRARERVERQMVNFYDVALSIDEPKANEILRTAAHEVDFSGSDPTPEQIFEVCARILWVTEHDPNCLGIAATQVGISLRIFTVKDNDGTPYCFVNPTVEPRDGALKAAEYEGCFSVPDRRVHIQRWTSVVVRGFTPVGEPTERTFIGRAARAAQHEMDHLDGILIDHYGEIETVTGDVIATDEKLEHITSANELVAELDRRSRAGA